MRRKDLHLSFLNYPLGPSVLHFRIYKLLLQLFESSLTRIYILPLFISSLIQPLESC